MNILELELVIIDVHLMSLRARLEGLENVDSVGVCWASLVDKTATQEQINVLENRRKTITQQGI